jgi:GT2 family glycosyltransferase
MREQESMTGDVCLSVVSHGQGALVRRLLHDLVALRPPSLGRVIITCNLPEDLEVPAAVPFEIEVIRNEVAAGFGHNHNVAFQRCSLPFFAVCNPDIRLNADPFPVLLAALATGPALAAPAVVSPQGELEDSARRLLTPIDVMLRRFHRRTDYQEPAWLAGMFLVFRADAFRRLRGFDEKFFMYCEDADICARAVLDGGGIAFCPQATVVHEARRASRYSFRPLQWHVASLLKFWVSPAFWAYRRYLRSDKVRPTVFRLGSS